MYINYFEFFCIGGLPILPIYLSIQSFISITQYRLRDIYFCTLGYNIILLYFVIQIVPTLGEDVYKI